MNKLNNTEIDNNINGNFQLTNKNQSLQTTKTMKQLSKLSLRFFAIVLAIAAFTFLPAQAQKQTVEDASLPKAENQEVFNQEFKEKLITKGEAGIPGQYIVVLKEWAAGELGKNSLAPALTESLSDTYGGEVIAVYQDALNGFAAKMSEEEALAMSKDERVAFVQQDQIYSGSGSQYVGNWGWGLDRIDQAYRPLNGYYNYYYTGAGVNVYVMDSGIRANHPDFGGRVISYRDFIGGNGQDCHGHGTHVAGTIGGATVGVAKQVRLINLRVLDCQNKSYGSSILNAVNWVTANHEKPAVVNMSLGTDINSNGDLALDYAVRRSIQAGVTYVIAAGNDAIDARYVSPARVPEAITVGATDQNDSRAYLGFDQGRHLWSNYGPALDLFAPGQNIWSTSIYNTNNGYQQMSGTSMAAPHVAGVAAMYLQYNPNASPATVHNLIVGTATWNLLRNIGKGSPNRLLDSTMQY